MLSRTDKPLTIGSMPVVTSFIFSEKSSGQFNSNNKTWLLLDHPQITEAPDGVYEIYLTNLPPEINNLTATNPAFVNVLDLYSITTPGSKQIIEVDIRSHVNKMFLQKKETQTVYVTLVFNGNQLANGNKSKKAGAMKFSGIRIVQTKE